MADADIKRAANDCVSGAFWAAGQNCLHVQRIYVERPAYDRFRVEMAARARCYITGPKLSDSTEMGCIIDEKEAARIELSVRSAIGQGGRIVVGGTREGTVMQPTLMENVPDGHVLMRDEVYGPVSLLASFDNFEEAVARQCRRSGSASRHIYEPARDGARRDRAARGGGHHGQRKHRLST